MTLCRMRAPLRIGQQIVGICPSQLPPMAAKNTTTTLTVERWQSCSHGRPRSPFKYLLQNFDGVKNPTGNNGGSVGDWLKTEIGSPNGRVNKASLQRHQHLFGGTYTSSLGEVPCTSSKRTISCQEMAPSCLEGPRLSFFAPFQADGSPPPSC